VEWYFGYSYPHDDLDCEDWRSRHNMWEQTRHALTFFQAHLPFTTMQSGDSITPTSGDYVFADEGSVYAVYLPSGGTPSLDLGTCTGTYSVRWYNPRTGGALVIGSVSQVQGPGVVSLGSAPNNPSEDWAVLVELVSGSASCGGGSGGTGGTGGTGGGSQSVASFTLINANTDAPVPGYESVPNGAVLDLSNLGTSSLSLRANTSPSTVGSVRFGLDGNASYRTENAAPYSLTGDTNGDYAPWSLGLGSHTVTATPYSSSGAGGSAGTPLTVTFTIQQ
jgi:hypothetical protein